MLSKQFKPTQIAKLVGLPADYSLLDQWDVYVDVIDGTHINITHPDSNSKIVSDLMIAPAAAQLLIIGKLGVEAQKVIQAMLEPALNIAMKKENWAKGDLLDQLVGATVWSEVLDGNDPLGVSKSDAGSIFDDESPAPDFAKPFKMADEHFDPEAAMAPPGNDELDLDAIPDYDDIAPPKTGTFVIPDVKEAMVMDKVKLSEATKMYQPVFSTSAESVYHCVGLAGDMKFAARRKGQDLSIRVEGPVAQYKDQLVGAGFNEEYIGKGYTSVHFHGLDDVLASRTIAAVLSGVGLNYETPIPNINNISQKGA